MASEKVDVSELLSQLKELKQKKACHMKKLKRKLGRAVALKQPDTKEETIKCDFRKSSFSKVRSSEYRNALTELNLSNATSSCSRLIENEPKSQNENEPSTANQLNFSSNIEVLNVESTTQVIPHIQQLSKVQPHEESTGKVIDPLKQTLNSSKEDDPNNFDNQYVRHHHKRSAVELEIDDPFINTYCLKKKTKVSCEETSNDSEVNKNPNLSFPETDGKDTIFNENFHFSIETFRNDLDCECGDSKSNCDISTIRPSKEKNEVLDTSVLHKNFCDKEIKEPDVSIKIDSNCLQKAYKNSSEVSSMHEKELDPNITEVADTEQLIESQYGGNNVNNQINLDIIEVAETEQIIKTKFQIAVNDSESQFNSNSGFQKTSEKEEISLENMREDSHMTKTGHETHSCEEKSFEVEGNVNLHVESTSKEEPAIAESLVKAPESKECQDAPFDAVSFEKICTGNSSTEVTSLGEFYEDFPTGIASFEEVTTENVQVDVIKNSPSNKLPCTIDCSFTDDEENQSRLFDSEDLTGLFMSDGQTADDSFEQIINLHSNQINQDVLSSPSKQDEKISSVEQKSDTCKGICQEQHEDACIVGSDIIMVPETELFDFVSYNQSNVDSIAQNISITSCDPIEVQNAHNCEESKEKLTIENSGNATNSNVIKGSAISQNTLNGDVDGYKVKAHYEKETLLCSLNNIEELDTDSFETGDFLRLSDYQVPSQFNSDVLCDDSNHNQVSSLDFSCCLQSDIIERVTQLKLSQFNNSLYLFIQHQTWIQVWRQEEHCNWTKIFAHQADGMQFQKLCFTQSENYLVLIMLLISDKKNHCLQFLVFERESRLIKLMEHTHWFENSSKDDSVFLCELDELKFATAEGRDTFKVHSHSFSCLEDSPRLLTVMLGSTTDSLHSLCRIDKLPNALLGMSSNMLYVWHHLEARLVTSVQLHVVDFLDIKNCTWATIENGLVFLIAVCEEKESPKGCNLFAANLATGFCEIVSTFTLQPALNTANVPESKRIDIAYSEPFIVAACEEGAFLWTVDEEYCCASLKSVDYSSVAIVPTLENSFSIVVGCKGGCVNCYELKYY